LKTIKRNPGTQPGFLYQKLNYYLLTGLVLWVAGLPLAAGAVLPLLSVLAAGFVSVLVVDVFVELACFDVVDDCADAPNAMVAATNNRARFLIVFICLFFNCE
jgi:hypothetical protein